MQIAKEYVEKGQEEGLLGSSTIDEIKAMIADPNFQPIDLDGPPRQYTCQRAQQPAEHIASLIMNILIECKANIKDKSKLRYDLAYKLRKHHDLKGLYQQFGVVIKLALENNRWQDLFLTIIRRTNMLGEVLNRHGFNINPVDPVLEPEEEKTPGVLWLPNNLMAGVTHG